MAMENKISVLQEYAWKMIGKPYIWGGDDPILGFDCSGLVLELLKSVGMFPYHMDATAQGIYYNFEKTGKIGEAVPGALVFYGKDLNSITHVSMIIEPGHVLEAGGGGSKTKTVQDAINQNAFIRIRPLGHRNDIVAIVYPPYWEGK